MWKIMVAFVLFAALALFVIMKGGDSLDMGGEKHGTEMEHAAPAPAQVPAPATAPAPAPAPASDVAPAK